jgi:hypothetical protein
LFSIDSLKKMLKPNWTPVIGFDNKININTDPKMVLFSGPLDDTSYSQPASSNTTLSTVQWSFQPPGNTILNSTMYTEFNFRLVFTATVAPGPGAPPLLNIGLTDAPRVYPVAQICDTQTLSVNGGQISFTSGDMISILAPFVSDQDRRTIMSGTSSYPDAYQQLNDFKFWGNANNPLTGYGSANRTPGRANVQYTIVNNTPASAEIHLMIREPVMIPPCTWTSYTRGLAGVTKLDLTYTTKNLFRLWSRSPDTAACTMDVSLLSTPNLLYNLFTSNPTIPESIFIASRPYWYNVFMLQNYKTDAPTVAAGGTKLGSGFILFFADDKKKLEKYLENNHIKYLRFKQNKDGVTEDTA